MFSARIRPEAARSLAPGETAAVTFPVHLEQAEQLWITPPVIMANGLHVYAPRVLVGRNLSAEQTGTVLAAMSAAAQSSGTEEAVNAAYQAIGITLPERRLLLRDLFHRYDSLQGEVFVRRVQNPAEDMTVYSYFGGTGVVTPDVGCDPFLRTTQLRMEDLQPGDILLVSDDYTNFYIYEAMFTGDGFLGSYAPGQSPAHLTGAEAAAYLDSLPGRYAYAILRPSLSLQN